MTSVSAVTGASEMFTHLAGLLLVAITQQVLLLRIQTVPLAGLWTVTDGNQTVSFDLTSDSGADIFSILHAEGWLSDPLVEFGDKNLRYISYRDWTFTHRFSLVPPRQHEHQQYVSLDLDEIDTYCCVFLNDHLLECLNNSFLGISIPLWSVAVFGGKNTLRMEFKSTPLEAKRAHERLEPNPPLPDCWPSIFNGECHINAVRTTQASFGWDWGPAFPIQGFWKIPRLRFNAVWIGEGMRFFPAMDINANKWTASVSVEVVSSQTLPVPRTVCVDVKLGGGAMKAWKKGCLVVEGGSGSVWMELPLDPNATIQSWWPNGVRSGPKMYALFLQLHDARQESLLDRRSFWVGFRQVELVQVCRSITNAAHHIPRHSETSLTRAN